MDNNYNNSNYYNQNNSNNMNYYNQNNGNNMNYYNQNNGNNMNYYNQNNGNNMNYYNQNNNNNMYYYNQNGANNANYNAYNGYSAYQNIDSSITRRDAYMYNDINARHLVIPEVLSKSFLFMFCALLITAFASFATSTETLISLVLSDTYQLLLFLQIGIVLVSNFAIHKNKPILAGVLYVIYSYITGINLSVIFLIYTTASVTAIFLITASVFAIMAFYGMATKKDLSSVGSLCTMALLGVLISTFVNLVFLHSTTFDTVISAITVLVFVGLTAYDTQKIKKRAQITTDQNVLSLALYGGFELYLDFINLFLRLLVLFGKRK